jgi:hypothetical protein
MRSSTFRWTLLATGLLAAVIAALLGFVYSKTKDDLTRRSDRMVAAQLDFFAALSSGQRLDAINERLGQDPRRVQLVGLFGPGGHRIAGNVERLPPELKINNAVQSAIVERIDQNQARQERQSVRIIGRRLPTGDILVIGRNVDEVTHVAGIVGWALALGLISVASLCLTAGALLSIRTHQRIAEIKQRIQLIVAGDLHERLPHRTADDPFSK